MADKSTIETSAAFVAETSLAVRVECTSDPDGGTSSVQLVLEDRGGTTWDLLAFGGDDDRPHRLAKLVSVTINFDGDSEIATLAGALGFAAEALASIKRPTVAAEVTRETGAGA